MGSQPEATAQHDLLEVAARPRAASFSVDSGQLPYSTVLKRNPNGPCDLEPQSECYDHGHKLQHIEACIEVYLNPSFRRGLPLYLFSL